MKFSKGREICNVMDKKRGKIRFTGRYIKKNCTFAKSVKVIKCNNDGTT